MILIRFQVETRCGLWPASRFFSPRRQRKAPHSPSSCADERDPTATRFAYVLGRSFVAAALGLGCTYQPACLLAYSFYLVCDTGSLSNRYDSAVGDVISRILSNLYQGDNGGIFSTLSPVCNTLFRPRLNVGRSFRRTATTTIPSTN